MNATTTLHQPSEQRLDLVSHEPRYGENYGAGYVGFTYSQSNILSRGIAYFTRWQRMHDIKVSHTLVVTGENECIEAHMQGGVKRSKLDTYFHDEHCQIFFRKPNALTPPLAAAIIQAAEEHLGCAYDIDLIAAQLKVNSISGHFIRHRLLPNLEEAVCQRRDHLDRWICSELVAHCLDAQPEYHNKGVLAHSDATIDPQELFEDDLIFQAWHQP
ncbi:MAG: hypothetical protein ACK6AD_14240 [Cyanobacteriota bacterium]|jgi:hypothetical protein